MSDVDCTYSIVSVLNILLLFLTCIEAGTKVIKIGLITDQVHNYVLHALLNHHQGTALFPDMMS